MNSRDLANSFQGSFSQWMAGARRLLAERWVWPSVDRQLLATVHSGDLFKVFLPLLLVIAAWSSLVLASAVWLSTWSTIYYELERWGLVIAFVAHFLLLFCVFLFFKITLLRAGHIRALPNDNFVSLRAISLLLRYLGELGLIMALVVGLATLMPSGVLVKIFSIAFSGVYALVAVAAFVFLYTLAGALDVYLDIEFNTRSFSENPRQEARLPSSGAGSPVKNTLLVVLLSFGCTALCIQPAHGQTGNLARAQAAFDAGNVAEAKQLAQKAVSANPRNPRAHLLLGQIRLREGSTAHAAKSFDFAIALSEDMRQEVAQVYFRAIPRRLDAADMDGSEAYLKRATLYRPSLRDEGIRLLYEAAIKRWRLQDPAGEAMLERWLSSYPDYSSDAEDFLFTLAEYFEAKGKKDWARKYYEKCAGLYSNGELGRRAGEILETRILKVNKIRNADCNGRLFASLKRLEVSLESTKAVFSLVWAGKRQSELRLQVREDTMLVGGSGREYPVDQQRFERVLVGQELKMRNHSELDFSLFFPPIERDELSVTVVLRNTRCGETSQGWGSYEFRFPDLLLGLQADSSSVARDSAGITPAPVVEESVEENYEIAVEHIHDYFISTGTCRGRLRFEKNRVVFLAEKHSFELPCEDLIGVSQGQKDVWVTHRNERVIRQVVTTLVSGRVVKKRGRVGAKAWHFLAQDETPPALIVSQNACAPR